jgi:large subunit ribosomal protein L25
MAWCSYLHDKEEDKEKKSSLINKNHCFFLVKSGFLFHRIKQHTIILRKKMAAPPGGSFAGAVVALLRLSRTSLLREGGGNGARGFSSSSLHLLREQQQEEEEEDKEFGGGGEFTKSNEEERRNSAADSSSSSDTNTNNKILRLIAHDREKAGRLSANRARKDGFIPCAVFKQGEIEKTSEVCAVSEREVEKLLRKFTKYGLRTKLIDIVLDDGKRTVKAIPQQIQMHAYKNQVNNITFMRVDPETIVKVPIPVKVTGQDDCPGTKLGAFVSHTRKTIKVKCRSDQIPEAFFLDVSNMNVKDNVKIANLDIPEGVVICEHDLETPIVKMAGKLKKS